MSKRKYRRSTPVGRVRKNLEKIGKVAQLVMVRLKLWSSSQSKQTSKSSDRIASLCEQMDRLMSSNDAALAIVADLEKRGWVPPRPSSVIVFEKGIKVKIGRRFKSKYRVIYSDEVLNNLVVFENLKTGEIAVEYGQTVFMVPKSHLEIRR